MLEAIASAMRSAVAGIRLKPIVHGSVFGRFRVRAVAQAKTRAPLMHIMANLFQSSLGVR